MSSIVSTFNYHYQPFQLAALPVRIGSLPTKLLQEAVLEFEEARRCNVEFGYLCALSAIAISSQNLIDVQAPNGHRFPTSLMMVGIGGASTGKSAAGSYFMQTIDDFEADNASRLRGAGFVYKNITGAALFERLHQLPSAGLVSYEGSEILNGIVRREATNLNAIWSGEPIKIHRKTSKSFVLHNARMSLLALVHPGRLMEFLHKTGDELQDIGFLARLIVVEAQNTFIPPSVEALPEPCRGAFAKRILELLEQNMASASDASFERKVMRFDEAASQVWQKYAAQLKYDGAQGGRFELAPEHAARLPQNAARIAALLHHFEGWPGDINVESLFSAIAFCEAASQHFMRRCVPEVSEETDAMFLNDWITSNKRQKLPEPKRFMGRAQLRKCAPNRLRDSKILDPLIDLLIERGEIAQFQKNGTKYLDFMPWLGPWAPMPGAHGPERSR